MSKNSNTALVWLAGVLLVVSLVFPNGPKFTHKPIVPVVPVTPHASDAVIVNLLANADPADKQRIVSVYTGLRTVLTRDIAKPPARITTTEQWAELHGNTLELAIDQPGKYPGLDVAIERVFLASVGTDDVMPGTAEVKNKLIDACDTIISSAQ